MHADSPCPDRDLLQRFQLRVASEQAEDPTNVMGRAPRPCAADLPEGEPKGKPPAPPEPRTFPFLQPAVEPDEIGRLGNYRVLRLLREGGMGYVFHAEDLALRRPVALKVMKPDLDQDVHGWTRFLREARAMAAIKHESLVTVFQVAQDEGVVYLAMELLEGSSLEDWMAQVRRPEPPAVLRVGREIAGGLLAIHKGGLIHRDIKLSNVWVEKSGGRVKILDFGLARFLHDDDAITQTGTVLGTPSFMSPEQARGEPVDVRSDLFSFGCLLYNLCSGVSPFHHSNTTATLTALAVHDPEPVHQLNPAVPAPLSALVMQMLAKDPEQRPASAAEVLERLEQMGDEPSRPGRTRKLAPEPRSGSRGRKRTRRPAKTPITRTWAKVTVAVALFAVVAFAAPWIASALLRPRANGAPPANAPAVYLAALEPAEKENWPILPPPAPGRPPLRPVGGVTVQGKESSHGIFMHPPPAPQGPASLTYALHRDYRTFRADVSLNDGPPWSEAPITFAVYGDGALLWQSAPLSRQADGQSCAVSVQGVDRLRIEVHAAGDARGAHAVWVEPCLGK